MPGAAWCPHQKSEQKVWDLLITRKGRSWGTSGGMGVNGRFTALVLMVGISLHRTDRSGLMYNSFLESSALYALLILKVIQKNGNLFQVPYFIFSPCWNSGPAAAVFGLTVPRTGPRDHHGRQSRAAHTVPVTAPTEGGGSTLTLKLQNLMPIMAEVIRPVSRSPCLNLVCL